MTQPHQRWTVLPHGELSEVADGIFTVVGNLRMPLMNLPRRMTLVRLSGSRLLVWSAIALDEAGMAGVEALGRPAFLVVPNDHHRLDAKAWKERYPQMEVVAPEGSRKAVEKVVPVATTASDFDDPSVRFVTVAGTHDHEAALVVHRNDGATLVLNDVVGNIRGASGMEGLLLRLAGFAGAAARIPRVVKAVLIKDPAALRAQLLQWADMASLQRILVSHGEPIEANPRQALRDLAGQLA